MTTPTLFSDNAIPLKTCLNTPIVLATHPTQNGYWPPYFTAIPSLQREVSPSMVHEFTETQTPLHQTEKIKAQRVEQTVTERHPQRSVSHSQLLKTTSPCFLQPTLQTNSAVQLFLKQQSTCDTFSSSLSKNKRARRRNRASAIGYFGRAFIC